MEFEPENSANMLISSAHYYRWFLTENAYKNVLSTELFALTKKYFVTVMWGNVTKVPAEYKKDFQVRNCNLILNCAKKMQ